MTYLELEKLILNERVARRQAGKAPIVTWEQFKRFGRMANMKDEAAIERAASLFHDWVKKFLGNFL
jgi:hypothetical protein